MKFSIIVPIYNIEKYLDKCVESLVKQTYKNLEIILVDDESPDSCPSMCDRYAQEDERIIVVHKKNGGLSDARNAGLNYATGDYIIFVDGDDYIDFDTCERFLEAASKNYDVLIGDAYVEGGNIDFDHIKSKDVMVGEDYLINALKAHKAPMATWLNLYKRKFLIDKELRFQFGILHEDEEFTPRALLQASSVYCTNISFYHYVIRENSITTKKDKRKNAIDFFNTCIKLEKKYNQLTNETLKLYLLDSLAEKYLSLFQIGKLYQYGRQYIHKEFIIRNAKTKKNRIKAYLYCVSPRLYYFINLVSTKLGV